MYDKTAVTLKQRCYHVDDDTPPPQSYLRGNTRDVNIYARSEIDSQVHLLRC